MKIVAILTLLLASGYRVTASKPLSPCPHFKLVMAVLLIPQSAPILILNMLQWTEAPKYLRLRTVTSP